MSASSRPAPPTLLRLFAAFAGVSMTSFGGGLSGWMMREFVGRRGWLDEDAFMGGLALAQAFPGVNVVNLSIWIGYRLRGGPGALAGALGMVVPAMGAAIVAVAAFGTLADQPVAHRVLPGVGAAAIGLSLQMGLRAGWRVVRRARTGSVVPVGVMVGVFAAIGVLRLPLVAVVLVAAPVGIGHAWWSRER